MGAKGKRFDRIIGIIFPVWMITMWLLGIGFPLIYYADIYNIVFKWQNLLSLHLHSLIIHFVVCLLLIYFVVEVVVFVYHKWAAYLIYHFILLSTFNVTAKMLVAELREEVRVADDIIWKVSSYYRQLYILTTIWNSVCKELLISVKFIFICMTSFGFTMVLSNGLTLISCFFVTFSSFFVSCLLFIFHEGGEIFEFTAQPFQTAWNAAVRKNPSTFRIGIKVGNSFRPCRIAAGAQYFLDRGVPFKILEAVLNNVITLTLAFVRKT